MKKFRSVAFLRLLCAAVVTVACLGVFATGAWAFNTSMTRTPAETLTYGSFSAAFEGLTPDETGQYTVDSNCTSLTLHTTGNVDRYVTLTAAASETETQTYFYYAASGDNSVTLSVQTDCTLTLTLAVTKEAPEGVSELSGDTTLTFTLPQEAALAQAEAAFETEAAPMPEPIVTPEPTAVPAAEETVTVEATPEPTAVPSPTAEPTTDVPAAAESTPEPTATPEPVEEATAIPAPTATETPLAELPAPAEETTPTE